MVNPPRLIIGGYDVPSTITHGAQVVALRNLDDTPGVSITWGRETVFDEVEPGTATVLVIDRTGGEWATDPARKGEQLIVIGGPADDALFRGTVADVQTEATEITLPSGRREPVTVAIITAQDPIAALSTFVPSGPSSASAWEGTGGWPEDYANQRVNDVLEAGARRFFSDAQLALANLENGTVEARMSATKPDRNTTALDLMNAAYAMGYPLGTLTYDPALDRLQRAWLKPADTWVELREGAGGTLAVVAGPEDLTVTKIPSRHVYLDDDRLRAPAETVGAVTFEWRYWGANPHNGGNVEYREFSETRLTAAGGARMTTTYTPPFVGIELEPAQFAYDVSSINRFRGWYLDQMIALLDAINGLARYPILSIDLNRPELLQTRIVWRTHQRAHGVYFQGNRYAGHRNVPVIVEIMGGTLTYGAAGWRHDVHVGPTAAGAWQQLTLDQLFPADSADTFDGWADDLTFNDLAAVSRRA